MDADVAEALRGLAKRVRHVPTGHNPERFHIEKSEIERALSRLAKRLDGGGRSRRTITSMSVNGRQITVQRRRMPSGCNRLRDA